MLLGAVMKIVLNDHWKRKRKKKHPELVEQESVGLMGMGEIAENAFLKSVPNTLLISWIVLSCFPDLLVFCNGDLDFLCDGEMGF